MDGETMETVTDFIFRGSKITEDGDCSREIKRRLLLARKAMTNLNSILKSIDITLPTKVHIVKAMVFPVVMHGCESWTIKKAEYQRIDAFELLCWRRLLRVPWTARRSNQSIQKKSTLNIHWKNWCWSWSSNTLASWCKEPTHWKRLVLRKIEGRRRRGQQRMRWLASPAQQTWIWANSRRSWRAEESDVLQSMGSQRVRHNLVTEWHNIKYICRISIRIKINIFVPLRRFFLPLCHLPL